MKAVQTIIITLIIAVIAIGVLPSSASADDWIDPDAYYSTVDEAAAIVRQAMVSRENMIAVGYASSIPSDTFPEDIFYESLAHTGVPTQGDYLRWQLSSCSYSYMCISDSESISYPIMYAPAYYTTAQQEAQVDTVVEKLLDELDLWDSSDYGKICGIYDWMCRNITYDYQHLEDETYTLKYTAYAALTDGTAVCQGYATLFYRLALELGVDCRVITGIGNGGDHAWNIVKLEGLYYNVDATWDASRSQAGLEYAYFLLPDADFEDHTRSGEYLTTEFLQTYPTGETAYKPSTSHQYQETVTAPTCTTRGYTTYLCTDCGNSYTDNYTDPLGHREETIPGKAATCTKTGLTEGSHCSICDTVLVAQKETAKLDHSWDNGKVTQVAVGNTVGKLQYTCTSCGTTKVEEFKANTAAGTFVRIAGNNRYQTSNAAANLLKQYLGVNKFNCIVIACGTDYADALSGTYLANQKGAPILLVDSYTVGSVAAYVKSNLAAGGTVYILGGTKAVPETMETALNKIDRTDFNVKRLAGNNRYETNVLILKEAGVKKGDDILVCTGSNYADCLSASATGLPILMVGNKLISKQTDLLGTLKESNFFVIGGTVAVSEQLEKTIGGYGTVERISGKDRFETSIAIANKFFPDTDCAVLVYSHNFPDGLSGGTLAYAMKAPILLVRGANYSKAVNYAKAEGITFGVVMGGTSLISDKVAQAIFQAE